MKPSQIVAGDDYASFPAIASALDAVASASNPQELSDARAALRKAELQRDIALGFTDLWGQWERDQACAFGLI